MMRRRQTTRHAFMLMEVVTGIGLLSLTLTGVYAGIHLNETMLRHYLAQSYAVDVLDNCIERLAASKRVSTAVCKVVLEDELSLSPLARDRHIESECTALADGGIRVAIRRRRRLLVQVRIGTP